MTAVFARDAWRPLFFIASCGLVGRGFLRYEVTEGGDDCKRPPPAWLHEKIRQPSAISAKSGIPYFFICHACLTSPFLRVGCIVKILRTREAKWLQTKGK